MFILISISNIFIKHLIPAIYDLSREKKCHCFEDHYLSIEKKKNPCCYRDPLFNNKFLKFRPIGHTAYARWRWLTLFLAFPVASACPYPRHSLGVFILC